MGRGNFPSGPGCLLVSPLAGGARLDLLSSRGLALVPVCALALPRTSLFLVIFCVLVWLGLSVSFLGLVSGTAHKVSLYLQ